MTGAEDRTARGALHAVPDVAADAALEADEPVLEEPAATGSGGTAARRGPRGAVAAVGARVEGVHAGVQSFARVERDRRAVAAAATEAATSAATGVDGVVRLVPRLSDVLHHLRARATRPLGGVVARGDGIAVVVEDAGLRVTVEVVADHRHRTATVAAAVQGSVAAAVAAATGRPVVDVAVAVLDIDLDPPAVVR